MKKLRVTIAVTVAVAGSMLFAPQANAAKECQGASGVIRCNSDRISCLTNGGKLPDCL
jgi:hypothetical protein